MGIRLEMKKILPLLMLCLIVETTEMYNVSSLDELRHPRVTGRIVKLYSGVKPDPILCSDEGFQADPVNCAVFYRCVKGSNDKYTVFRYQCGPGTVYDPDTEVCNHPINTKRSNCGGRQLAKTASVNENEIDGSRQEVPTPITTKQPVYTEKTTENKDVTTSTRNPWPNLSNKKISQSSITSTSYPWVTTIIYQAVAAESPVSRKPSRQVGEQCTSEGFMGDTENCRKFYRCVGNGRGGYIRYEFSCSELTIWDDEAQACNHAWAVKKRRCGRGNPDNDKNNTPIEENEINSNRTIQSQLQISYGSKVNQVQTQISKGRITQNQTQINYGNGSNDKTNSQVKQNQTQISHGSAVSQTQTQINHGNNAFQTQLQIDHTKESSQSQSQINEVNTEQTNASPQDDKTQKPYNEKPLNGNGSDACTESGFMGDSKDCKKFYRCVDNGRGSYMKHEFSCGEGTVWDPNAEACNHEWAVKDCKNKVTPETTSQDTKTTTTSTKSPTQQTTTIDITTAEDEDVGYGGQNQEQTSTSYQDKPITTTESTTRTTQASTTTLQITSSTAAVVGTVCTSSGFMGDSTDCKKFYRCVDNGKGGFTKYEYKCGEGTVWDTDIEACNHAWAVTKCGSTSNVASTVKTTTSGSTSLTTVIQTTTRPSEEDDSGYGQPQNESPLSTTTSTSTPKQPELDGHQGNNCKTSGFMGDDRDCKKFYRCVDNGNGAYTRYEYSCGEGTVWDPKIEACNHAWAVEKCGKGTTNENTLETTTQIGSAIHDEVDNRYPSYSNTSELPQSTTDNTIISSTTTSSTASTSSSNNICKSSGFMDDKNDCKKFYRCVEDGKGGFIRYDFTCGEGTVWDQSISACNHPSPDNDCKVSETSTHSSQVDTTTQTSSSHSTMTTVTDKCENGQDCSSTPTNKPITDKPTSSEGSCTMEGFFGDTKDCKKFYRCVDNQQGGFTMYDFTCGEGTMWDPEINACNHIRSVKNGCNSPTNNMETTQNKPMHENDEYAESSTSEITTTVTTSESGTEKPSSSSKKCESEGFFANPEDCKKFYRCVDDGKGGYTKYDFSCGDGTIWDEQAQTCNHESSQTKCSQSSGTSTSEKPQTSSEASTQNEFSNESTTSKEPPVDSTMSNNKDQCSAEGFYSNSNDCKKFYRCVDNGKGGYTKYDFSCGEGTVWVQELQACDHDNDISNCSSQTVSSTSSYQEEQHSSTDSSTSTSSSTTERSNDEISSDQSDSSSNLNECESEGFFPNKNDCKKFYRCVDNGKGGFTSYDFTCGDGTAWDSEIQACNHINQVKNCKGSQNQNQSDSSTTDENSSQTTEATSTTKTSTTESSDVNKQPTDTDKCEKEGYFGDSNNCQKFYRCVDNGKGGLTKYDYTCGEGTIWDQDILACNHPRDVENPSCKSNNTSATTTESSTDVSSTTSGTSTTSSESSSSTSSTEGQGSSDCSQSSTQKPQNKNVNCTKAGFYADPDDCKKFYRCVDWDNNGKRFSIYHFDCGEGTIWDPDLETCNHEDSVYPPRDCSGTQSQGQNTTDESTTTTTTEKSTTSKSTTQESTATEESTTEKSTTSEQTTETSTSTTESSTTQQSTTTESTTTSEQTTTEQSDSTTQKSTTTEKSTTQESSTTEQATTQQSSTTAESTTEQTSTTEQSTTQQASTTEESTTQQSSSEQSTTENEQTTTQQSTTSEQTTTQQSTTTQEETTTTEQSTTEQSTTEQTTESSTEQSSTTAEESTAQESSTTEQTTDATESSTTEQSSSTTTEQSSDSATTESEQQSTTESSSDSQECPETDDDQNVYVCPTSFRRHPKYCNMFYQCTEEDDSRDLHIAVFKCPNNTIYDESKTQCVDKDKADKKCEGEIEERKRVKRLDSNFKDPIIVSKEPLVCPATGHYPFEKSECSPAFLKCDKTKSGRLRGYVHRCPEGYVYWSISRRCETKASVRNCKVTANDWRDRWEIPTERKNIAT